MEQFPGNSNQPKTKKIEPVVVGRVSRRKQPIGKRLITTLIGGDAKSVLGYILGEVLLPAAKDMVADAISQGAERLIFGDSRPGNRRTGYRPTNNYVNYGRYSQQPSARREEPRSSVSQRARSMHDFDEIILDTRPEAEAVIENMFDLISKYEAASVADLYELVGIQATHVDTKWGWVNFRGAGVNRVRDGYLLDLPRPTSLD